MGPQVQPKCFRHAKHMRNNWELRKRGYLIRFGHTEALLLKKRTLNGHFSRPAETDPYVFPILWIRNYLTHLPRRRGRVGWSAQIWRPNPLIQPTVPSAQRPVSNLPFQLLLTREISDTKCFEHQNIILPQRTWRPYEHRSPLYLGMKHLYKKCPPLWYGHFGAVFVQQTILASICP